jgi:hypothetical protein
MGVNILLENMRRLVQWGKQVIVRILRFRNQRDLRNIRASGVACITSCDSRFTCRRITPGVRSMSAGETVCVIWTATQTGSRRIAVRYAGDSGG